MKKLAILAALYGVPTFAGLASISNWPTLLHALAMIETGCTNGNQQKGDFKVGASKEISRYQLLPSVWRAGMKKAGLSEAKTTDPIAARLIARTIWEERRQRFAKKAKREPSSREWYALWNAPGAFEKAGFQFEKLSKAVRERSERFANLVEDL